MTGSKKKRKSKIGTNGDRSNLVQVNLGIDGDLKTRFHMQCLSDGTNMSVVAERLIRWYLANKRANRLPEVLKTPRGG